VGRAAISRVPPRPPSLVRVARRPARPSLPARVAPPRPAHPSPPARVALHHPLTLPRPPGLRAVPRRTLLARLRAALLTLAGLPRLRRAASSPSTAGVTRRRDRSPSLLNARAMLSPCRDLVPLMHPPACVKERGGERGRGRAERWGGVGWVGGELTLTEVGVVVEGDGEEGASGEERQWGALPTINLFVFVYLFFSILSSLSLFSANSTPTRPTSL
jgi:hypothetical protein